jgi:FmdE, Molybdenum formylmethanofuran dehydrogenase operon
MKASARIVCEAARRRCMITIKTFVQGSLSERLVRGAQATMWMLGALLVVFVVAPAAAQTKEQWIELGTRIHGGFGVLIPIGIRIGLDAKDRLKPEPRQLTVTFSSGAQAPCPCIADGIMMATGTSPGQGSLLIAPEPAPAGFYAIAIVRNRKTGEGLRYTIAATWAPRILAWNRSLDPAGRFDAAMQADDLFEVAPLN